MIAAKPLLPFGARTAQRLVEIAKQPLLQNPTHGSDLPPSWRTLYELAKLPDLSERLEADPITPGLERAAVAKWRKIAKAQTDQGRSGIT